MSGVNDWGLPDWRNPKAYGDTKQWSMMRWKWEFYRRREDLRQIFDQHAVAIYENKIECEGKPCKFTDERGHLLRHDEPGFVVDGYYKIGEVGYEPILADGRDMLFGLWGGLPNPRISDQPDRVLRFGLERKEIIWSVHGRGKKPIHGECVYLEVLEWEMAFAFNLDAPLEPQIKIVRESLRGEQNARHGGLLQIRKHPSKWLTYLQVLDARETGASWSNIARLLPRTAGTEQAARDTWEQANALRFNF